MADTAEKPTEVPAAEAPAADAGENAVDDEIEALEAEITEMANETNNLKELADSTAASGDAAAANSEDIDKRSCYVGNVDYGATPEELQEHFKSCGGINRITIMVDRYTCCPKGYAYMEFADEAAVANATLLNDSLFRGRQLKVVAKRTNVPGFAKGKGKDGKKGKGKKGKSSWGYAGYAPAYGKGKGKKGKKADPYAWW